MENRDKGKIKEAKAECRREARRRLKETDSVYRRAASDAICDAVTGLEEYRSAGTVLAYSSVGREVATDRLLDALLADGKRLCLPRCTDIDENGRKREGAPEMEARLVSDLSLLSTGAYGIKEPVIYGSDAGGAEAESPGGGPEDPSGGETADMTATERAFPQVLPADIDLVILPCLACDADCGRLGHGAGYYDKFLSELREDCVTVAVCFDKLILDKIPMEEHDMPVKAVITEKAVYRWRP